MDQHRSKKVIGITTLASAIFVVWNTADESYILQNPGPALIVIASWLALPCLNMLVGLFSPRAAIVRTSMLLAIAYSGIFLLYAVNGSTAQRESGHMHLVVVPILLAVISAVWVLALLLLTGAKRLTARTPRDIRPPEAL